MAQSNQREQPIQIPTYDLLNFQLDDKMNHLQKQMMSNVMAKCIKGLDNTLIKKGVITEGEFKVATMEQQANTQINQYIDKLETYIKASITQSALILKCDEAIQKKQAQTTRKVNAIKDKIENISQNLSLQYLRQNKHTFIEQLQKGTQAIKLNPHLQKTSHSIKQLHKKAQDRAANSKRIYNQLQNQLANRRT